MTAGPAAFAYVVAGASVADLGPLGPRLTAHELGPCIDELGSTELLTEPSSCRWPASWWPRATSR